MGVAVGVAMGVTAGVVVGVAMGVTASVVVGVVLGEYLSVRICVPNTVKLGLIEVLRCMDYMYMGS